MTVPVFDVAVIGAGMLGAATAHRLCERGSRVVVLDAGTATGGATGNSFSWLNAVSKEPEAYHRLNALGAREYERLEQELGTALRHQGGCLEWTADAEDEARLDARVNRLQARGYLARWISRSEAAVLEPGLALDSVERAVYYEGDAWVDAPAVARLVLDRAEENGAEVREGCPVTRFRAADGDATLIEAGGEWLSAGTVVLCAGTGTPALARMLGTEIPVERRPGLLAVTSPVPEGALARVVYAPGVHVRPDVSGGLRIGADDVDALTQEDTPPGIPPPWAKILLHRVSSLLRLPVDVRITHVHIGVRPVPADGVTVAGRLPGWENAYVGVTHSGITLGPLLGRLLADEITTTRPDPLLADFRPERFQTTH